MQKTDQGAGTRPTWMKTYANLSVLLLTFFVLLLSMANMDVQKFETALGSVRHAFGTPSVDEASYPLLRSMIQFEQPASGNRVVQIRKETEVLIEIRRIIKSAKLDRVVEAEQGQRGVTIRMKSKVLFATGKARLRETGALDTIAKIAKLIRYPMMIEGHSDDIPIKTRRFPSNWELSVARAAAAMRYLVDTGGISEDRIAIAGYADLKPRDTGESPEARAKNRRVEFVFLRPKVDDTVSSDNRTAPAQGDARQFAAAKSRS